MKVTNVLLLVQCAVLFLEMINITKQRIKEYKERLSKGVNLYWIDVNPACEGLNYNLHHHKHKVIKENKKNN